MPPPFVPPVSPLPQPTYIDVRTYIGDPQTPWEVKHQRQSSADTFRFLGTPILLKRMYTVEDKEDGVAVEAPTMDDIYKQATYYTDALSHGVGYVSPETQPGEWYDPATNDLYISDSQPDPSYLPAPRYRGYGPGFITYAIFEDRPEDQWKLTEQGALVRQQTAMIRLPWWPQVGDNDLIIMVDLNPNGQIAQTYERYQLKSVAPVTFHGLDRRGNREFNVNAGDNRYWVGQSAELTKVPSNDPLYSVEVDR